MSEREAFQVLMPLWRYLLSDEAEQLTVHELAQIVRAARDLYRALLDARAPARLQAAKLEGASGA